MLQGLRNDRSIWGKQISKPVTVQLKIVRRLKKKKKMGIDRHRKSNL